MHRDIYQTCKELTILRNLFQKTEVDKTLPYSFYGAIITLCYGLNCCFQNLHREALTPNVTVFVISLFFQFSLAYG